MSGRWSLFGEYDVLVKHTVTTRPVFDSGPCHRRKTQAVNPAQPQGRPIRRIELQMAKEFPILFASLYPPL